jgi:hypothetical protein
MRSLSHPAKPSCVAHLSAALAWVRQQSRVERRITVKASRRRRLPLGDRRQNWLGTLQRLQHKTEAQTADTMRVLRNSGGLNAFAGFTLTASTSSLMRLSSRSSADALDVDLLSARLGGTAVGANSAPPRRIWSANARCRGVSLSMCAFSLA